MKKLIVLLVVLLMAVAGYAATRTATFAWTQDAASLPLLAKWNIYSATKSGGPYTLLSSITYDGTPKAQYTGSGTLTQADGTSQQYFFVCRALGKSGIESANSNEVSATIDLTVPGIPVSFQVLISTN
jgi:hypothetical protein